MPVSEFFASISRSDFGLFLLILAIAGLVLFLTQRLLALRAPYFFLGLLGLIIGLTIGSLVANTLTTLPGNFGRYLPITVNALITVAILDLFLAQTPALARFWRLFEAAVSRLIGLTPRERIRPQILVDTSVLIDGRLEPVARSGFLEAKLLVPRFVIEELQAIADAQEPMKRTRGRRGLEVLSELQKMPELEVTIIDDFTAPKEKVDSRLIKLAQARQAAILTLDFNLNRVAVIHQVKVLNLNELANALKPVLLPGETLVINILEKGKEKGQGIGYLPDGTMIVVEGGEPLVGQEVSVSVERIFQSLAGKMIFAKVKTREKEV